MLWLALSVAPATLPLVSCGSSAPDEAITSGGDPTIAAEVGTVTRRDLVDVLTVRGSVIAVPNADVKIASLVAGRVDRVTVAEGDAVRAGDVIAEIDPRPFADQRREAVAGVAQAKAGLENATLNLDRNERLFARGIAAGKEVEDARAQVAVANAALETASAILESADRQLARAQVVSPLTGLVVKRLVSVGEQVDGTAAQPIVEIANLDDVEIAAAVPAGYIGRVRVTQRATVTTEAFPEQSFDGEVVAVAPAIDVATNTALARIRIANRARLLKVGMFAQARITVGAHPDVLTVPPSAVAKGDEDAVYVVSGDTATRTKVTLGFETSDAVEVESGVSEGQHVLTSAVHGLGERARLTTRR